MTMEFSNLNCPPRQAFSAPTSRQSARIGVRRERVLSAFPGWFFNRSPYRVSNRQAQRRFQSEPPQNLSRGQGSSSLPAATRHRPNVGQNDAPHGMPSTNQGANRTFYQPHSRRLQSLPGRNPAADEGGSRTIKSAPDNGQPVVYLPKANHTLYPGYGGAHRGGQALANSPPHARSRIADHDPGPAADLHQKTHGIATRAYEETYLRSNKFASSWARVRAENPTFMEGAPGQMVSEKHRDDSQSPGRSPRHPLPMESPYGKEGTSPYEIRKREPRHHSRGRKPFKRRVGKKQKLSGSRSPRSSRSAAQDENRPPRQDTDYEESGSDDESDANKDSDIAFDNDEQVPGDRKVSPRRQPWDESVVVPVSTQPPPKLDARRCRHDLIFKPAVNTDEIVTKAYSGQDEIALRERVTFDENVMYRSTDDEDGYASPGNESGTRSYENSPDRAGKERMLSKREARMYIKMMSVYGSDAFKNQRKEWFVKRLNDVQETKSKLEEQEKQNILKKREEDKIKQKRQLDYVRSKFRREQLHRFHTQYVTARVLEYEHVNRHTYGLPEDFEDLAYLLRDEDGNEIPPESDDPTKKENKLNGTSNKKAVPPNKTNQNNKKRAGKSEKQCAQEARENEERQKEEERLARARKNQSAWYANTDTSSTRQGSPTSHGTSGYESEKSPSEKNGNLDPETNLDLKQEEKVLKQDPTYLKKKGGRQQKHHDAENRLAAQKQIYEKKPPQRMQPKAPVVNNNVENRINQRKRKDDEKRRDGNIRKDDTMKPAQGPEVNTRSRQEQEAENGATLSKTSNQERESFKSKHSEPPEFANPRIKSDDTKVSANLPNGTGTASDKNRDRLPSQSNKKELAPGRKEEALSTTKGVTSKEKQTSSPPIDNSEYASKPHGNESENDNLTRKDKTKQPTNSQQLKTGRQDQFNSTGAGTAMKSKDSQNQPMPSIKSEPKEKPLPEDDIPVNIKRVPLAGTISKENAPQTFGVTENKLEDMLPEKNENTSPVGQTVSISNNRAFEKGQTPSNSNTQPSEKGQTTFTFTKQPSKSGQTISTSTKQPSEEIKPVKEPLPKSKGRKENFAKPVAIIKDRELSSHKTRELTTGHSAKSASSDKKTRPKKTETLADKMFNIKTGPTWNPHAKVPKMEGIDTVVVSGKDGKGRVVKKKRNVDAVVREASNLLKVSDTDTSRNRTNARSRRIISRAESPAVTLGSDFDVDIDDEPEGDIFERLRRKYNIQIDSDEEGDGANIR